MGFEEVFPETLRGGKNRISIGAVRDDGAILGAFSAALKDYEIVLDWLFVHPAARRQGVATALMDQLRLFITDTGELYPTVASFPVTENNTSLHRFFLSLPGTEVSFSHDRYFVSPKRLQAVAKRIPTVSEVSEVKLFFDQPEEVQKKALEAEEESLELFVEDWEAFRESCEPELSRCLFRNGKLSNLLLIRKAGTDLEIVWLYSSDQDGLYAVFRSCAGYVKEHYPEAGLTFDAMNRSVAQLGSFLFPHAEKEHIYQAELYYTGE